jgi:hypothetical protein
MRIGFFFTIADKIVIAGGIVTYSSNYTQIETDGLTQIKGIFNREMDWFEA